MTVPAGPASGSFRLWPAIAFLQGAGVLAIELAAGRLLIPLFGQSLELWTLLLTLALGGLALGYALGARLARTQLAMRLRIVFFLAGFALLTVPVWVIPAAGALSSAPGIGRMITAAALVLLPSFITLGAATPLLVGLVDQGRGEAGPSAGHVFAVSTLGSLVGGPLAGFVALPVLGLRGTFIVLGAAFLVLGLFIRPKSAAKLRLYVLCISIVIIACYIYSIRLLPQSGNARVLGRWRSASGHVAALELAPDPATGLPARRVLLVDGWPQNEVEAATGAIPEGAYQLAVRDLLGLGPGDRALVLGLGAGVLPMALAADGVQVLAAEPNPAVIRAAEQFFYFEPARVRVRRVDGRQLVRQNRDPVDAVVVDAFVASAVPSHLFTREALVEAAQQLSPSGVWVAWVLDFPDAEAARMWPRVARTARDVFADVQVFRRRPSAHGPGILGGYLVRGTNAVVRGPTAAPAGFVRLTEREVTDGVRAVPVQTDDRWDLDRFGGRLNAITQTAIRRGVSPALHRWVID